MAAFRPTGSYGSAKSALHTWAYSLAAELAPDGITVNLFAPGFVPDTDFTTGHILQVNGGMVLGRG